MQDIIDGIVEYTFSIGGLELLGLIFGLLAVYYLIKQNILTWITGIIYVLVSFVIFWQAKLYADLGLHVVFLVLNIYGWVYWTRGREAQSGELQVSHSGVPVLMVSLLFALAGILGLGFALSNYTDASLAYWDSITTILSIIAMWMMARKYIENWILWFIVDVLAVGIYLYKGIYFYALLYFVYLGMAVSGYLAWRKSMIQYETR